VTGLDLSVRGKGGM